MLELFQMLVLAVVQGFTEFLPVSSSGHLVLAQALMGAKEGDVFFDVVLHLGTLGSVVVVYRREVGRLLRFDRAALQYILSLVIGTLPAAVIGFLFKDRLEELFHNPVFAAGGLFVTAAFLFSTRFSANSSEQLAEPWQPQALPASRAFFIGCSQTFAILPGISRSGATIASALWLGVPRAEAARFSFLLSIPVILGALVLQVSGGISSEVNWLWLGLSALAAFSVGLLALRWTALAVVQAHFWKFSVYCIVAGAVALLIFL